MCDAILIALRRNMLYVISIEQKSGHKGDSKRQLRNGRLFCEWILRLFRENGYAGFDDPIHVSALVWQPRNMPKKGATGRRASFHIERSSAGSGFDYRLEVRNEKQIIFADIAKEIDRRRK